MFCLPPLTGTDKSSSKLNSSSSLLISAWDEEAAAAPPLLLELILFLGAALLLPPLLPAFAKDSKSSREMLRRSLFLRTCVHFSTSTFLSLVLLARAAADVDAAAVVTVSAVFAEAAVEAGDTTVDVMIGKLGTNSGTLGFRSGLLVVVMVGAAVVTEAVVNSPLVRGDAVVVVVTIGVATGATATIGTG